MEPEELPCSGGNELSQGRGCPKREVSGLMVSGDSGLLC